MSREQYSLDPVRVQLLLDELVAGLNSRGVTGHLVVVGGAAIALRYPDDDAVRVTQDVDAAYTPRDEVNEEAQKVAERHSLPTNWLNDHARAWVPDRIPPHGHTGTFAIESASVHELIAMKMAAFRPQDLHDLTILARRAGLTDPQQLVDIAYAVYGEHSTALSDTREDYGYAARDVFTRMGEQDKRTTL